MAFSYRHRNAIKKQHRIASIYLQNVMRKKKKFTYEKKIIIIKNRNNIESVFCTKSIAYIPIYRISHVFNMFIRTLFFTTIQLFAQFSHRLFDFCCGSVEQNHLYLNCSRNVYFKRYFRVCVCVHKYYTCTNTSKLCK